jgi:hypothetical protein
MADFAISSEELTAIRRRIRIWIRTFFLGLFDLEVLFSVLMFHQVSDEGLRTSFVAGMVVIGLATILFGAALEYFIEGFLDDADSTDHLTPELDD